MLKTRNVFVLKGVESDVNSVLGNLQFKGLTELLSSKISFEDIAEQLSNNKSVVCSNVPEGLSAKIIEINVVNSLSSTSENCINIKSGNISEQFQSIALSYNCDIDDHKSDDSGLTGAPSKKDCPYCIEFISNTLQKEKYKPNRVLYESDNFVVMPTVGEFVKGYLLIIPREHVMSLAELSLDLRKEFLEVLDDVITILKLTYPVDENILVWENGTGNGGIGKAKSSIVHAHVHVAPSKLTAGKIKDISGFLPLNHISFDDLSLYGKHSYLLIKGSTYADWFITDNPDLYIPRQYVRQLIAEDDNLSGDIWNWRIHPFYYLIKSTCRDVQNALMQNWDSLSDRIKKNTKKFLV